MNIQKIIAILLLTTVLLSSCNLFKQEFGNDGIKIPGNEIEMPESILSGDMNLDLTKWDFINYDATLDFMDGRYLLNAGCNSISGNFNLNEFEAKFEPGISTMMFCGEEVNKTESELSKFIITVKKIENTNGILTLISDNKEITLEKAQNAELVGSKWALNSILDNNGIVSHRDFENSFIKFDIEGKISGIAVCNNIMGTYEIIDGKLNISKIAMTRKMCNPDSFSESKITNALENIDSYEIVREELILKSSDGKHKINFSLIK